MTLEDQSGRVRLVGEIISKASVVTGVIIGALGMETPAGDFEVIDYCLPGLAPQRERKLAPNAMDIDGRSRGSSVQGTEGCRLQALHRPQENGLV